MPDLEWNKQKWTSHAKEHIAKKEFDTYGYHWGDPEKLSGLNKIKKKFINPYINESQAALEIGPGGGRWTQYLLDFKIVYCVDINDIMFELLREKFDNKNIKFIKNDGTNFPEVPNNSIEYVFSFGTFVHLEPLFILEYLKNLKPKLAPNANVVIQYSDKNKKVAKENKGFSQNNPDVMRAIVLYLGYQILEEDLSSLIHSSVMRFTNPVVLSS